MCREASVPDGQEGQWNSLFFPLSRLEGACDGWAGGRTNCLFPL